MTPLNEILNVLSYFLLFTDRVPVLYCCEIRNQAHRCFKEFIIARFVDVIVSTVHYQFYCNTGASVTFCELTLLPPMPLRLYILPNCSYPPFLPRDAMLARY